MSGKRARANKSSPEKVARTARRQSRREAAEAARFEKLPEWQKEKLRAESRNRALNWSAMASAISSPVRRH